MKDRSEAGGRRERLRVRRQVDLLRQQGPRVGRPQVGELPERHERIELSVQIQRGYGERGSGTKERENGDRPEHAHFDVALEHDEDVVLVVFYGVMAFGAEVERAGTDGAAVPCAGDRDLRASVERDAREGQTG